MNNYSDNNILKTTFREYEINLPENYSFADVENFEEQYLKKNGDLIVLLRQQQIIGFVALLPSDNNLRKFFKGCFYRVTEEAKFTVPLRCRDEIKLHQFFQ